MIFLRLLKFKVNGRSRECKRCSKVLEVLIITDYSGEIFTITPLSTITISKINVDVQFRIAIVIVRDACIHLVSNKLHLTICFTVPNHVTF